MKTAFHLILIGSLGASLALAQEPGNPPPSPQRPTPPASPGEGPRVPDNRPPGEQDRRDVDRPRGEGNRFRPNADRPRPPGDRRPDGDRGPGPGSNERPQRDVDRPYPPGRPQFDPPGGGGGGGVRREGRPFEEKLQPYIGIVSRPAAPDLAAQLKQPEGFGLVVDEVLGDSPAQSAGLQRNDLLLRLDDQLLVNPGQLEALIRRAGKDKEVALTLLRGGEEKKINVRIGEKMLPVRRSLPQGIGLPMPGGPAQGPRNLQSSRERGDRPEEVDRRVTFATERARIVRKDDQGEYELTREDGGRTFVVKRPNGEELWRGHVETRDQRRSVPEEWRGKLEMMENAPERERSGRPGPGPVERREVN